MKYALLLGSVAAFAAATSVSAQTTTPAPAQPAPSTAAPAAPSAPSAAPAPGATAPDSFTDADLKSFARAAIAASKIQQDTTVPADQKQPKMLAAVQAEGLDPAKFNAIAQASNADPSLKQRIQAAATADAAAAPAAPAPASPPPGQ